MAAGFGESSLVDPDKLRVSVAVFVFFHVRQVIAQRAISSATDVVHSRAHKEDGGNR